MTEYKNTTQGAALAPGATVGADTIDLLIRHLEAAKLVVSSSAERADSEGGDVLFEKAFPNTVCGLFYGSPGTFCPLLYIHFPMTAVTESA